MLSKFKILRLKTLLQQLLKKFTNIYEERQTSNSLDDARIHEHLDFEVCNWMDFLPSLTNFSSPCFIRSSTELSYCITSSVCTFRGLHELICTLTLWISFMVGPTNRPWCRCSLSPLVHRPLWRWLRLWCLGWCTLLTSKHHHEALK